MKKFIHPLFLLVTLFGTTFFMHSMDPLEGLEEGALFATGGAEPDDSLCFFEMCATCGKKRPSNPLLEDINSCTCCPILLDFSASTDNQPLPPLQESAPSLSSSLLADSAQLVSPKTANRQAREEPQQLKRDDNGRWPCPFCSQSCSTKQHTQAHIRTHTGEQPFVCEKCNQTFTFNCNLKVHIRTHTRKTPFTCYTCSQSFRSKLGLMIHVGRNHKEIQPASTASAKPTTTMNEQDLQAPPWANPPLSALAAATGGLNFRHYQSTPDHLFDMEHPTERLAPITSYPQTSTEGITTTTQLLPEPRKKDDGFLHCHIKGCDKSYKYPSDLNRHRLIHADEKPFKCKSCSASFARGSNLTTHTRMHATESASQPASAMATAANSATTAEESSAEDQ